MTKEIYQKAVKVLNDTKDEIQKIEAEITYYNEQRSTGKYAHDWLNNKIQELKNEKTEIKEKAQADIKNLCDVEIEALRAADDLNPAQVNEDELKLLNAGVRLTKRDIDAMLKRNEGNHTMTQIILRHCKERGIDAGFDYVGNDDQIESVKMIPTLSEMALRWTSDDTAFEKIMEPLTAAAMGKSTE